MSTPDLGFAHRYVPAEPDQERTLLLLHGTGGDEDSLLPLGSALAPGAALLSPRGKVLERGMPRFFRRIAEGVLDVEDLIVRTHELAGFIDAATASYGLDPKGLIAVGYSNGANIAAALLLLRPGTLAGAALLRPMVPLRPAEPPDLARVPVFIAAGRYDPLVPALESAALVNMLRGYGAAVTLHWQDGGHDLDPEELAAARTWLGGLSGPE